MAIMLKTALAGVQTNSGGETDNSVSIINLTHRNADGSDSLITLSETGTPTETVAYFDSAMVQATIQMWTLYGYVNVIFSIGFWE